MPVFSARQECLASWFIRLCSPPGVGPGFYRVEITKAGEDIPPKYNTDTILGLDTSMNNPVIYKGVRIDLAF